MTDIFLSYAHADQARIELLAEALKDAGFSLWWDDQLRSGSEFADEIETEIDEAQHVLVAWSANSVKSRWVRDEANEGAAQGKLVSISLDGAEPPIGFRQFHATDMADWKGGALPKGLLEALNAEPAFTQTPQSKPTSRNARYSLVAAFALMLAGTAYWAFESRDDQSEIIQESLALGILPFVVSGDSDDETLGAGMAGALNIALADFDNLALSSPNAVAELRSQGLVYGDIGERLSLSHLFEGELQLQGSQATLSATMIEAATGRQIWTSRYRGAREAIGDMTFEMTAELSGVLQSRFGVGEGQFANSSNVDPAAYDAYLRGIQHLLARGISGNRLRSFTQLQQSIARDPEFGPSHAALAFLLSVSAPEVLSLDDDDALALTNESIEQALQLDPGNIMARSARTNIPGNFGGDYVEALTGARELYEEHPQSRYAQFALASRLSSLAYHGEAIPVFRQLLETDPLNALYRAGLIRSLMAEGDYDALRSLAMSCASCEIENFGWLRAISWLANLEQFENDWPILSDRLIKQGFSAENLSDLEEFVRSAKRGEGLTPVSDQTPSTINLALTLVSAGETEAALATLAYVPGIIHAIRSTIVLDIATIEWPDAARADPRYHAFFSRPDAASLVEGRREVGHIRNLPVFPIVPYRGAE